MLRCSQAEARSLQIPMRLLALLKESLQPALPANGTASMPNSASPGSLQHLSMRLEALPASLPGTAAAPRPKRRRSAAKAAQLTEAEQQLQQQQSRLSAVKAAQPSEAEQQLQQQQSSASEPLLNGSSRQARVMTRGLAQQTPLNGVRTPAKSIFHGPMKPLRSSTEEQDFSAAHLNGAHSQQQPEPEQASVAAQTGLEISASEAEPVQELASVDGIAEAAIVQEAVQEAACTEALSIALSGKPPTILENLGTISWSMPFQCSMLSRSPCTA